MTSSTDRRLLPLVVLAIALAAVSFGSIFVRLAAAPALAAALWRMTLAAAVVVPVAVVGGGSRGAGAPHARLLAAAAGALLALHFAAWISSLDFTTVAISVLLVNTAPVWVALIAWAVTRQAPRWPTWLALALTLAGGGIIAAGEWGAGNAPLGHLLALVGAAAMAGYLLLARQAQRTLPYLEYVGIAFGTAAAVLWLAVLVSGARWHGFSETTWLLLAGMAVVSQLVGHGGYNWALRHLHPVFVAVTLTGEPVLAAGLAWWLLGEPVPLRTAAGGVLVLGAIVAAARDARR